MKNLGINMVKKFLFVIMALFLCVYVSAQESPDTGDGGDEGKDEVQESPGVYHMNARGDQFIRIALMPNFPLNFGDKLYVGGAAQLGYFYFLTGWLALGGELMIGYNPTLGSNSLAFLPLTFGIIFQPSVWRFEFPITLSAGIAFETCANKKYFPAFASKSELDVFYRINDSWSVGLGCETMYLPEWYTDTKNAGSDYGLFITALIAARYHF